MLWRVFFFFFFFFFFFGGGGGCFGTLVGSKEESHWWMGGGGGGSFSSFVGYKFGNLFKIQLLLQLNHNIDKLMSKGIKRNWKGGGGELRLCS